MKYYNKDNRTGLMSDGVKDLLDTLRARRGFDVILYLETKANILNSYMFDAGLSTCVVAVSGGIDSAVVLALVRYSSTLPGSPIKNIWPVTSPVYHDEYTKNQDLATNRATELCESLGLTCKTVNLTTTFDLFKKSVDDAMGIMGEPWAAGQAVAYLRTPVNYYITSLASQLGEPAIVVGTTNRDEGAYLGYVGKASDGIVDVQLISDLHKSEVRAIAKRLKVPESILQATPTGDMYDGRVDEEVFGTTYDFVELFLLLKSLSPKESVSYLDRLNDEDKKEYETAAIAIEELHRFNSHKYKVGSPAYHLDILESGVEGGWNTGATKISQKPDGKEHFVNAFELSGTLKSMLNIRGHETYIRSEVGLPKGEAFTMDKIVDADICKQLLDEADSHGWQEVGIDGIRSHYSPGDVVGSLRASTFSPELADAVWSRLQPLLSCIESAGDDPQNSIPEKSVWRPIGVSPLARFIRYDSGGQLIPHYDYTFSYSDTLKTLKTIVIYLESDNVQGGNTRFLTDNRIIDKVSYRDLTDRKEFAGDDDVLVFVDPKPGQGLVFDHVILHDGQEVRALKEGARKVIIRMDVVYERCQ
jgi:NAD+ synthetase